MTLGQRIHELRTAAGLSQEQLAERLNVSRQAISKWELDTSAPDLDRLVLLGDLFGVSLDQLVRGPRLTEPPPASRISASWPRKTGATGGPPFWRWWAASPSCWAAWPLAFSAPCGARSSASSTCSTAIWRRGSTHTRRSPSGCRCCWPPPSSERAAPRCWPSCGRGGEHDPRKKSGTRMGGVRKTVFATATHLAVAFLVSE